MHFSAIHRRIFIPVTREHKNEYEFRKTFNDVKMVMMIHSETGTKILCVSMLLLLFLRDIVYITNAIQLLRLNE